MKVLQKLAALSAGLMMVGAVSVAQAGPVITNAGFETVTNGVNPVVSSEFGPLCAGNGNCKNTAVTGWNATGYTFVFLPTDSKANSTFGANTVWFWSAPPSPDGGNFIAADPVYPPLTPASVSTSITGLTAGNSYTVSFWYAGAQQQNAAGQYSGATTEQWQVTAGATVYDTALLNNGSHGFTGWDKASFNFTATGASQVLTFLALGGPSASEPPFDLLDGVSIQRFVPEPITLSLFGAGLIGAGAIRRRRAAKKA